MQLEPQRDDAATAEGGGTVICHNCRTALVPGMRFCRGCGYRLGEGVAEYVETVRFGQSQVAATMAAAAGVGTAPAAGPFGAPATTALQSSAPAYTASRPNRRRNRWHTCSSVGSSWWLWVVIAFAVFIAAGGKGAFRSLKESVRGSVVSAPSAPRSFFGTSGFETADGRAGALLEAAEPGGPADVAGLVGGDIVTSFDGTRVQDSDDMRALLKQTPAGKTVEVEYLRDGETRKTQLTTITAGSYDADDFYPPQGKGQLEINDLNRVRVPSLNIYGVEVGKVHRNGPAELAGWKGGDVVVEFNGAPIRTRREFERRIDRAAPGSIVTSVIVRNGQRIEIPVKVGRE